MWWYSGLLVGTHTFNTFMLLGLVVPVGQRSVKWTLLGMCISDMVFRLFGFLKKEGGSSLTEQELCCSVSSPWTVQLSLHCGARVSILCYG